MARGPHVNDFTVETNSQCFICSGKVLRGLSSVKLEKTELGFHSVHSLQYLSRYLKMDMRKMFHKEDSIPPDLLAKVQKSKLKVELCEDCRQMNEAFSKQYKQLEKIKIKVRSSLELIHRKFQKSLERHTNTTSEFQNLNVDVDDFHGKMEIVHALRTEALLRCKRKLQRPSPFVRIQRLSRRELVANQLQNQRPNAEDALNSRENLANVKIEVSILLPDQNDTTERDYFDDYQSNLNTSDVDLSDTGFANEPVISNIKGAMQRIVVHGSAHGIAVAPAPSVVKGGKYTINPETGKLKCNLCSMEFKKIGFFYHYKSIHLGIKYKCNLCEKVNASRPAFNHHHKSLHKGMSPAFSVVTVSEPPKTEGCFNPEVERRKCDLCSMEFASADELQDHYGSAHPDVKYRCKLCHNEFGHFSAYQHHACNNMTIN